MSDKIQDQDGIGKHTPGPWYVTPDGYCVADKRIWFEKDGSRHGETPNMLIFTMTKEQAHLIAAAPNLLESLENLILQMEHMASLAGTTLDQNKGYQSARAARAKAKGLDQ